MLEFDAEGHPLLPQEVLDRLPSLDRDALAALFDAYFPRIYGYLRRLVGSEQLAEDLTQEVFVHLHQALPKYDPARDLRPWLFTLATNKLRDHWRSRQHRLALRERTIDKEDDEAPFQLPAQVARPEEELDRHELEERVRQAVEALPEGLRMTVLLRVYEGLSFEEIGEILGRNAVAVRKRYSRGLEALRGLLEREQPEGA